MSKRIPVTLPDDLAADLGARSQETGASRAEIIRRAVRGALEAPAPEAGSIDARIMALANELDDPLCSDTDRATAAALLCISACRETGHSVALMESVCRFWQGIMP